MRYNHMLAAIAAAFLLQPMPMLDSPPRAPQRSRASRWHKNAGLNARERAWREKERAANRKALAA